MATSDILREMINVGPQQVEDIQSSIGQIDSQIDDLNTQIDGVQNGMCVIAELALTDYLENTKIAELEPIYGGGPYSVIYGPDYGTINYTTGGITDFVIVDVTSVPVYSLLLNWDADATITKLIDDYEFGNDYLTRPITSGATYGLIPARDNMLAAKSLLQENSDQIESSITTLEDYAS